LPYIKLENVELEFPIYDGQRGIRKELFDRSVGGFLNRGKKKSQVSVTALREISIDLKDGDRVALIGHNGSGKTTLLQVIAGIYEPHVGHFDVSGRVSALLNTSLGMDADTTGYNNIWICGLLLGMTPDQIHKKIDEIAEFTELGDFLALPVRTYSTGMQTRLAFAITTAIEPEILLLDEGIGTGDAQFQAKAEARIQEFVARSNILVFASHSPALLQNLCTSAYLLEKGRIIGHGNLDEILEQYHSTLP
jgi:ABC-type polysaccharide/polyol phosphate transport system ATPase subunit